MQSSTELNTYEDLKIDLLANGFDELFFDDVKEELPKKFYPYLFERKGAAQLLDELPKTFLPEDIISPLSINGPVPKKQAVWERIGLLYFNLNRLHEALPLFAKLYDHMLLYQESNSKWVHKGMPLFWVSKCYMKLGCSLIAYRYMMLALCEDAIYGKGSVAPETTGTYFQLVWFMGLSDLELNNYAKIIYKTYKDEPVDSLFPEWVLQQLDNKWTTDLPTPKEGTIYSINRRYVNHLVSNLGDGAGLTLEVLADYLMSCMPGCRTFQRKRSLSTDYDIVCSMEGLDVDFRSEFGRYFVCECKDWAKAADFTTMAKFCRVLDSIKARFGILFSKEGISGTGKTIYAEREQLKVYQDRGMVIVVVDENDIKLIAEGVNFITMLREKYEKVRLDLSK